MKRGDVFTISTRGPAAKPRPGVIVQTTALIREGHPVLGCPLTSDLIAPSIIRPTIRPSARNGLRVESQAMVDRMTGAQPREIGVVIGRFDEIDMRSIDLALLIVLGLAGALTNFSNNGETP